MFIGASVYIFIFSTQRRRGAEALEIMRGREASHKKQGTGMGESMWAQFCADIENDSSAEREISDTQPLQKSYKNKKNTTADVRGL